MPHICEMSVGTVCAFRGQVFAGCFMEPWHDATTNTVGWSLIGHACFQVDRRNESGYMHLSGSDYVHRVVPSRNGVIAYGDGSIGLFYPTTEPVVTYGFQMLAPDFGIAGRDAVAGDGEQHFFMDPKGDVWIIDNKFNMQKLGFRQLFGYFVDHGEKVTFSYDSRLKQCHIAFDSAGFTLGTDGNLHEVYYSSSKVNLVNGELHGSFVKVSDENLYLETDIIDFGISGKKSLTSVELLGSLPENPKAAVLWRNDKASDFRMTSFKQFSPNGICYLYTSGVEFKVVVTGDSFRNTELELMAVKYQIDDKRNIRGPIGNVS